jgi:hypothetical protein
MRTFPIKGKALCIPHAKANLLSVRELIKGGGSFQGIENNNKGSVVVEGTNNGDGFWTYRLKDIKAFLAAIEDPENEDPDETTSKQDQREIPDKVITHLNTEDRARAQRAFDLNSRLGHPGDESLKKASDNGVYAECDLTGQDLINAWRLHKPFLQCLEGKMSDSKMSKQSVTPPAKEVGEHLHADKTTPSSNSFPRQNHRRQHFHSVRS